MLIMFMYNLYYIDCLYPHAVSFLEDFYFSLQSESHKVQYFVRLRAV